MEKKGPIIIYGSARHDGHTKTALNEVLSSDHTIPVVDLNDLNISYFDYENTNQNDDFLPLVERMVQHNTIILASPVYWYCMSAVMKTFIDRWSDLLTVRKDLGRKLADKWLYVVTSYGTNYPIGFEDPIRLTCQYMDIRYGGCYFHYSGGDETMANQNRRNAAAFQTLISDHL